MRVDAHKSNPVHPAPVQNSQTITETATLGQNKFFQDRRNAVSELAETLALKEADLQRLEADIESFTANHRQAPQLRQLHELRQQIGLLESRLTTERQEAENAEAQMKRYAMQRDKLQKKVEKKREAIDAVRCKMAEAPSARAVDCLQPDCIASTPRMPESATSFGSTIFSIGGSACQPSVIDIPQPSESEKRIADLARKLNALSAEAAALRKAAADLEKQCADRKNAQQTSETRRETALHPKRVVTARSQHQAELHETCRQWGMQTPHSEKPGHRFLTKSWNG